MNAFGDFDNFYWGILPQKLANVEKVAYRIGSRFELTEDMYQEIEETAVERAGELLKYDSDPVGNLTDIICTAKLEALLDYICRRRNLDLDDFTIDINTDWPSVIYKGEDMW